MRQRRWSVLLPEIEDPTFSRMFRQLERRARQWQIVQTVHELRRAGEPAPVAQAAERFGVTTRTVQLAFRSVRR